MVAAEKDGVLILILQALLHKQRPALLLGVIVGHIELGVVLLRLVHRDGVRHLMTAALGGQRPLEGVGDGVGFVLLPLVRFDAQRLRCCLEGVIGAQTGPVMVGAVEHSFLLVLVQGFGHRDDIHALWQLLLHLFPIFHLVAHRCVLGQVIL